MKDYLNRYLERLKKEHRFRLQTGLVFFALALCVTAGVFWGLKLTGYSVAEEPVCGLEEHAHTDECYEKALICGLEETEAQTVSGHVHTEECYIEGTEPVCGPEETQAQEFPGHIHTEECYEERLICGKEEHTHTEECFAAEAPEDEPQKKQTTEEEMTEEEAAETEELMALSVLPETVINGGNFGDGLYWELTEDTEGAWTLTISGEGAMPDYTDSNKSPWDSYMVQNHTEGFQLVVEEGITRIGNYSFSNNYFEEMQLPETLEEIGNSAFFHSSVASVLKIPAKVKKIGDNCFSDCKMSEIILPEGLTQLGSSVFFLCNNIRVLNLPSTLQVSGNFGQMKSLEKITVAEGNPYFQTDDLGVLFQRFTDSSNQEAWKLFRYPPNLPGTSYEIPDTLDGIPVSSTANLAFANSKNLTELTIPQGISSISNEMLRESTIKKVVFKNFSVYNIESKSYAQSVCKDCDNLQEISWENITGSIGNTFFINCKNLQKITIPKGITGFETTVFENCTGLESFYYNAQNAVWTSKIFDGQFLPRFALTIGADVDTLPAEFTQIASRADSVSFAPSNHIDIAEGAMNGAPEPFSNFRGTILVDAQGIIYTYDQDKQTAEVAYCPAGLKNVTIPETILSKDGTACTVTGIQAEAFLSATDLTNINFAGADKITKIGAKAFYGLSSLTSVNGQTNVMDARNSFGEGTAEIGNQAFRNTGLQNASGGTDIESGVLNGIPFPLSLQDDQSNIMTIFAVIENISSEERWTGSSGDEKGGYTLYTGENMKITMSSDNKKAAPFCCRIYCRITDADISIDCAGLKPGASTIIEGQTFYCRETADPWAVCFETTVEVGKTVGFDISATYPSPKSAGGGLQVWGEIVESTDAELLTAPKDDNHMDILWKTQPMDFALKKASKGNVNLTGDGDGNVVPENDLQWELTLEKNGTEIGGNHGKDLVKSVEYTDEIVLPEFLTWTPEAEAALKEGKLSFLGNSLTAGNVTVATLNTTSYITGRKAAYDAGTRTLSLSWKLPNASNEVDLAANKVTLGLKKEALTVDTGKLSEAGANIEVPNTANATIHYHYAQDRKAEDSDSVLLQRNEGKLTFTKSLTESHKYFGEPVSYQLTLSKTGLTAYTGDGGVYTVEDTLDALTYCTAEQLKQMFADTYGDQLSVRIENATLADWETVTGIDEGSISYKNSANTADSELSNVRTGRTLVLTKAAEGGYQVTVDGEADSYSGTTVAEALQNAGYAVNGSDRYTLIWAVNPQGETDVLKAGEVRKYQVYATIKDTFRQLGTDWPNHYIKEDAKIFTNKAAFKEPNGKEILSASQISTAQRECVLEKQVSKDGKVLEGVFQAERGDILDYSLSFTHYGSGVYEHLPMVDDLLGSQCLLVPMEQNPKLAEKDLPIVKENYYILNQQGTYEDVVIGIDDEGNLYTAEKITVSKTNGEEIKVGQETFSYSGLHTQIKWYFPELSAEKGKAYERTVTYQAIVDTTLTGGTTYSLGNIVWMNDRPGSRLYDSLWGGGTIIDFDKNIVVKDDPQADADQDGIDDDDYSMVSAGESVTYRIDLTNKGNAPTTVSGKDFADALPFNGEKFAWTKENVRLRAEKAEDSQEITYDSLTKDENWNIANDWSGMTHSGQQYLTWNDSVQIHFQGHGTLYLYITLDYPKNTDGNPVWDSYAAAVGGNTIENTFYLEGFSSKVVHNLREAGKAVLQKGVYAKGYYNTNSTFFDSENDRDHYSNPDFYSRYVTYYGVIYNGGSKRLYLNTIYDKLPEGFTYLSLTEDGGYRNEVIHNKYLCKNTITTMAAEPDIAKKLAELPAGTILKSAQLTATPTADGAIFRVKQGGGTISYDEKRDSCYLENGEALVFGYIADIGPTDQTEKYAENVLAMPYDDYLGTGVTVAEQAEAPVRGVVNAQYTDTNDGSRLVESTATVKARYGFTNERGDAQWLTSNVMLTRGEIVPGITKKTESYSTVNAPNTLEPYENVVGYTDTVHWRVFLNNSGTHTMTDYTFTDTLPKPYTLNGDLTITVSDAYGNKTRDPMTLLSFGKHLPEDTSIPVRVNGTFQSLTVGKEFPIDVNGGTVCIDRSADGKEVLTYHVTNPQYSIPEGGHAEITLSAANATTTHWNMTYINQAELRPTQEFAQGGLGIPVKDENGKPVAVRNSADVNVSQALITSSEKKVEAADDKENAATSTDDVNYIALKQTEDRFWYTLTVNNLADQPMEKLILIDTLPMVGDSSPFDSTVPRGSEFTVIPDDEPDFTVTVTPKAEGSGAITTLTSEDYTVQYSGKTDFGGTYSDDWKGEATEKWTDASDWVTDGHSLSGVHAIRILINDEHPQDSAARKIPPQSTVSVKFKAKALIDETQDIVPEAGSIAWNSFGYHYMVKTDANGQTLELEAMPHPVGVKAPNVPLLEKKLTDANGHPSAAEKDRTFNFLISTVQETEAEDPATMEVTVTVKKGQSSSDVLKLLAQDGFEWKEGRKYTIQELFDETSDEAALYRQSKWNGVAGNVYTFTYDRDTTLTLTCTNEYLPWEILLTKTDFDDKTKVLPGAWFALYSPEESDKMSDEKYETLPVKPEEQITASDSQTYYLKDVSKTDKDGRIQWSGLTEETYYLVEVQAPEGYNRDWEPQIVSRGSGTVTVEATDSQGFTFPMTGGVGKGSFAAAGAALLLAAVLLWLYKNLYIKKQKKGDSQ